MPLPLCHAPNPLLFQCVTSIQAIWFQVLQTGGPKGPSSPRNQSHTSAPELDTHHFFRGPPPEPTHQQLVCIEEQSSSWQHTLDLPGKSRFKIFCSIFTMSPNLQLRKFTKVTILGKISLVTQEFGSDIYTEEASWEVHIGKCRNIELPGSPTEWKETTSHLKNHAAEKSIHGLIRPFVY